MAAVARPVACISQRLAIVIAVTAQGITAVVAVIAGFTAIVAASPVNSAKSTEPAVFAR